MTIFVHGLADGRAGLDPGSNHVMEFGLELGGWSGGARPWLQSQNLSGTAVRRTSEVKDGVLLRFQEEGFLTTKGPISTKVLNWNKDQTNNEP